MLKKSTRPNLRRLSPLLGPMVLHFLRRERIGVLVIGPLDVAKMFDISRRHLARLEQRGKLPRRRRIGPRLTGYLAHELLGGSVELVRVRDLRTVNREIVAAKLGVTERTVARMVRRGEISSPVHRCWFERDLDDWLLTRPKV